ncbi:MAG: family 78 glycoside hydrolase catalytic domain [Clostridia bacterium]|nr:family 78 glycoside hydrolase catalytic domain [Clostridia bacterium]
MSFRKAKWIWVEQDSKPDTYGEFYNEFMWKEGNVKCLLSCDSDYTLFINGRYVESNQYADYEWYKVYDEIDITSYLTTGKNSIAVLVWHFGVDTQRYKKAQAGVIFELQKDAEVILASDENTRARYSQAYRQGIQKLITRQLGLSFFYDATKEDGWMISGTGLDFATVVDKNCALSRRPIKKLELLECVHGSLVYANDTHYVIDLGRETVGLATLKFSSPIEQKIHVEWGEDLQNGSVRAIIGNRDFSFDYIAKAGVNEYTNYMLRLGCRYLEIHTEAPIEIERIGVIPQVYPIQEKQVKLSNALDQRIYNACLNTLKLCMMEHYVDTPWREQCLYVYDSRNQALFGYQAFEGGNADYVRANLKLISKDCREDGLLSICYPCGMDLTIPSFSLYYFMEINEYLQYTGDVGLAEEVYEKLISVLNVFIDNRKDGLVTEFKGANHWNFYDWSPYLDVTLVNQENPAPDLMINILFILALKNLREIDERLGKRFAYDGLLQESEQRTKETFFRQETGLYAMTLAGAEYTVLGNALAILAGLTSKTESERICERIVNGDLSDCSLSMKIFKYDALLATDKKKYRDWVLREIRREYGVMTKDGNTVWETIDGAQAFGNAGSLCHGWSAIPIRYYTSIMDD